MIIKYNNNKFHKIAGTCYCQMQVICYLKSNNSTSKINTELAGIVGIAREP